MSANVTMSMSRPIWAEPGAVLAYHGRSLTSLLIRMATGSPITHVAIIAEITADDLRKARGCVPEDWRNGLYVVESTTLASSDCEVCKRPIKGIQVHSLSSLLNYDGKVGVTLPSEPLTVEESKALTQFLLARVGLCYDYASAVLTAMRWVKKWLPCLRGRRSYHCSEEVADALVKTMPDRVWPDDNPGTLNPGELIAKLRTVSKYSDLYYLN